MLHRVSTWTVSLSRFKKWKNGTKFVTWKVRRFCRIGSLKSIAQEEGGGVMNGEKYTIFVRKPEGSG
jgi:hypothetical protein